MPTDHDTEIPPAPTDVDAPVDDADDGGADEAGAARRPGTTHPRLARERALKVLFQADVRGEDARVALDRIETTRGALALLDELEPDPDQVDAEPDLRLELTRRARLPLDDYTRQLVGGVASRRNAIDRLLGQVSDNWAVSRMPVVDRNLLRLAIHELVVEDTPHPIVIDEAVALARGFAGDKAVSFVNGVLEAVRQAVARGDVDLGDSASLPEPAAVPSATADGSADGSAGVGGGDDTRGSGAGGSQAAATGAPEPAAPDVHAAAAWSDALDLLGMAEPASEPEHASEHEHASESEHAPVSAAALEAVEVPESRDGPGTSADPDEPGVAQDADGVDDRDDLDPETEVAILLGELGPDGEPLDDDQGIADGSVDDRADDRVEGGADIAADSFDTGFDDVDDQDDAVDGGPAVDGGSDTGFDDEDDDRFEGFDDLEGAEQDSLFGDLDDED